jgi:hypothetical protein
MQSTGIRLAFSVDCFPEEICESKADYAVPHGSQTRRRIASVYEFRQAGVIHQAAVRLILLHDTFTKEKQYPSASVFHPPQRAGFYSHLSVAKPRCSTIVRPVKTPPRRGMESIYLSNTMDCRCTIL